MNISMNSASCSSVGWKIAHTLSIIAVKMIWKDSPNVMSASSFVKKKKISPSVRSSSLLRCSIAVIIIPPIVSKNKNGMTCVKNAFFNVTTNGRLVLSLW